MLTIIPFKNVSRDKEDSYLQLLDKMRTSTPSQLIDIIFAVDKEQIYFSIFKTNDLSKLTSKSYEKNVKQLAEFFTIFSNVFSQIEDLDYNNTVHNELFEKLINFVFNSFQTLFKSQLNEAFIILVNLHKFLHKNTHFQQKLISFILEKFLDNQVDSEIAETITNCKDSILEMILSCIEAKYDQTYYINLYVRIYNFFLRLEELPSLNDKKIYRHASNLLKKGSNLPNEFIRLTFYLNYINSVELEGNINIPDAEILNLLPKTGFSFETILINSLIKSSLADLRTINREEGVKNYGRKSCGLLLSNVALRISYSKLQAIKETELSFLDLLNKYSISIEDLEEVLIDGNESNLFEVIVDYKSSKILIKYVKRNEFSKESIVDMKNKITGLRQKITNLKQRIDSLTN